MDRKTFIRIAGLGSVPLLFNGCLADLTKSNYSIKIDSNRSSGHMSREKLATYPKSKETYDTIIIGAGVSGIAAYSKLNKENTALFDLNGYVGGTAGGGNFNSARFARGAHYDIIYPSNYGKSTLDFLVASNIIVFDEFNQEYHYKDSEFLINPENESTCLRFGVRVDDPITGMSELPMFERLLRPFKNEMVMPTTNIDVRFDYLNEITFRSWLEKQSQFSAEFYKALDYQMRDDWGAPCSEISALSGIHYYMCRDYNKELELISPPEGNQYFVQKMLANTNYSNIQLNHLCHSIQKEGAYFKAQIVDLLNKRIKEVTCNKVIYAGNKHALKYICPQADRQEMIPDYSAWVSINIVVEKLKDRNGFWQNDMITEDETFLGFSDSRAQFDFVDEFDVFTAYYCFDSKDRSLLEDIEENPKKCIEKTLDYVEKSLGHQIRSKIKMVNVNLLGHAMPVPKPGYLKQDWNTGRPLENFTYAGCDTGKLPLFFEAVTSGLEAVESLRI